MRKFLALIAILAAVSAGLAQAEEGKLSGKVYFNYNHDFSDRGGSYNGQSNGFNFTRIYFGYDKDLDADFSIRFLMDVDNTKDDNGKSAWRPFMKNAYLSMNCKLIPGSKWYFGMVGMPFVSVPESHWGYRSLAQMATDKQGWGSTADLGVGWKGKWQDQFQIEFAVANGAGYKNPEADMFKLIELRPTAFLLEKALTLSAFLSYETQAADSNSFIFSALAGYEHQLFRIGGEYSMRSVSAATDGAEDVSGNNISLWGVFNATDKLNLLARYDMYEPNADVDADKSALIVAGLDFHPIKNVRFIPNVQIQTFEADDDANTAAVDESKPINTAYVTFEYSW